MANSDEPGELEPAIPALQAGTRGHHLKKDGFTFLNVTVNTGPPNQPDLFRDSEMELHADLNGVRSDGIPVEGRSPCFVVLPVQSHETVSQKQAP
jgi:hypothetical protein